jgi:hypothetical protein
MQKKNDKKAKISSKYVEDCGMNISEYLSNRVATTCHP